jgi:hypothetical protein
VEDDLFSSFHRGCQRRVLLVELFLERMLGGGFLVLCSQETIATAYAADVQLSMAWKTVGVCSIQTAIMETHSLPTQSF